MREDGKEKRWAEEKSDCNRKAGAVMGGLGGVGGVVELGG